MTIDKKINSSALTINENNIDKIHKSKYLGLTFTSDHNWTMPYTHE